LKDCYIDSATAGHRCADPQGQGRCSEVVVFVARYGWRSFKLVPELVCSCSPHHQYPLQLIYLPLDQAGTRWFAVNIYTGERKELDLTQRGRLTVCGGQATECAYSFIPHGWTVIDRDAWWCTCPRCTGRAEEKKEEAVSDFIVNGGGTNKRRKIVAGSIVGDPTCAACQRPENRRFGGCEQHRKAAPPRAPSTREWREMQRQKNGSAARQFAGGERTTSSRRVMPATTVVKPKPPKPSFISAAELISAEAKKKSR
jgi:hypothetical protein